VILNNLRFIGFIVCLLITLIGIGQQAAFTQELSQDWSTPLALFETDGRASEAEVIADQYGTVHVFWAYAAPGDEEDGATQSIYHAGFQDGEWSKPVDILVSPDNRVARMQSLAADAQGYLHIVWSGSDTIYYSRANAPLAGTARGWTKPQALTSKVTIGEPAIAVDSQNRLYVVWSQVRAGLVFSRSEDGGDTWSLPETIFDANQVNELARWGRIAIDDTGRLHVVLTHTVRPESVQDDEPDDPNFLYYLNSDDLGETWSEPFLITPETDFGEVNVVTYGKNVVHLVWNGRASRTGRYHRWSDDGGRTWSDVIEVVPPASISFIGSGGLTGFPALATDATGTLHMVSATGGGDYYFQWQDGTWSDPLLISPGLDGRGVTGESSSLEQPSIDINEGDQLHVVFHDGFERIWYTSALIDAPEQEPVVFSAEDSTLFSKPTIAPTSTEASRDSLESIPNFDSQNSVPIISSSNLLLLASIVPAFLLIGIVILFARRPKR